jgi:SAM-dependent methyltransferase
MELTAINQYFGNLDIYLLDQILKKRFHPKMNILDAGCGEGRNLMYFLRAGYTVKGIDKDPLAISAVQFIAASMRPDLDKSHFQTGLLENMPFTDHSFDLIICSAVLHFAETEAHFYDMFDELIRCLNQGGILFVRMASDIGIENRIKSMGAGRYWLPDGTQRFLLNRKILDHLNQQHSLRHIEPLKTVNVNDTRCMSTLVLSVDR